MCEGCLCSDLALENFATGFKLARQSRFDSSGQGDPAEALGTHRLKRSKCSIKFREMERSHPADLHPVASRVTGLLLGGQILTPRHVDPI